MLVINYVTLLQSMCVPQHVGTLAHWHSRKLAHRGWSRKTLSQPQQCSGSWVLRAPTRGLRLCCTGGAPTLSASTARWRLAASPHAWVRCARNYCCAVGDGFACSLPTCWSVGGASSESGRERLPLTLSTIPDGPSRQWI